MMYSIRHTPCAVHNSRHTECADYHEIQQVILSQGTVPIFAARAMLPCYRT